jgi:glutathione S-transferase
MYTVYGQAISGNCYKLKLCLSQLRLPFRWVELDILAGATHTPEFLIMNPNGQVPVLGIDAETYLPESNAALCYLAEDTLLFPSEKLARARVLQWLFWEQNSHEPYVAGARFILKMAGGAPEHQARLAICHKRGVEALDRLELRLGLYPFLTGDSYTIADLALYAYTHVADEGGFDMTRYPAIRTWLDRVAAQPDHVKMLEA